jgi:ribosomal RNA-processing protein 36
LELAEQYRELKKSGRLEKYLMKKRKKNAHQEKKKLPGKGGFI